MKLLEGKCGIVTGGSRGIGEATAVLFAQHGAKVVIADILEKEGIEVVEKIKAAGGEAWFCLCDVRFEDQVKSMTDFAAEKMGKLDFVINNAGVVPTDTGAVHETHTDDYMRVIDTNVHGVYYGMKYGAPYLIKNGGGTIVNTCSINSTCCNAGGVAYGTSKFAAYALTQCAALDYAKMNIRVNAIGPGPTKTPMIMQCAEQSPELIGYLEATIPDGRMGEAEDCAKSILFLCSDLSSHVNGQLILVDGGQGVKM